MIFEEHPGNQGKVGIITLNRPQALNALNHTMFNALDHYLSKWGSNPAIKAVMIRAVSGRAFCAGGDIRLAYERKQTKDPQLEHFFRDEYVMNRRIFHFPKPYIALLNGITMGGGAGISMHGSHRVATERMTFAMPETGIGFFPDIGASYFLSRLPFKMGCYLGVTGETIAYNDCHALGLVDDVIAVDAMENVIQEIIDSVITDNQSVSDIIAKFSIPVPKSQLLDHQSDIVNCFAKTSVEEIIRALQTTDNAWCHSTADIIKKKSPTSLKVTLQELQRAEQLDFDECMQMEYHMMQQFIHSHDFFEGIRAALIDKDRNPHWQPATLEEVSAEQVMRYFSHSEENGEVTINR